MLLELIANDLELSDIIIESVDGDQVDGFRETIKLLVEKLLDQIKGSIKNDAARPENEKQKFIKALIRIFIKQSAKLVINLWPGQKSLLDRTTDQKYLCLDRNEDQTSDSLELETNPGKEN